MNKKVKLLLLSMLSIVLIYILFLFIVDTNNNEYTVFRNNNILINSTSTNSEESTDESGRPQTFDGWRAHLLNVQNMSLEDLDSLDSDSLISLNTQARIYHGWTNGTYSDEEKDQLLEEYHCTPIVALPLLMQFSDDYFKIKFTVSNLELYEHVFRVYGYLDFNKGDTNTDDGGKFADGSTEKIRGPFSWVLGDRYPYDVLPYKDEMNPKTSFIGPKRLVAKIDSQQNTPIKTYTFQRDDPLEPFDQNPGNIYHVVQVLWRYDTFDVWNGLIYRGDLYHAHYKWLTVFQEQDSLLRTIQIYDDDPNPPIIPEENYFSLIPGSFNPVDIQFPIFDSDPSFTVDVCAYDTGEGVAKFIEFDESMVGDGSIIGEELIEMDIYGNEFYADWFRYNIPNHYAPGDYETTLTVFDNDDDGWSGDRLSATRTVNFKVFDDDLDPPTVSYLNDWEIFDNEGNLEIILNASDYSGIDRVYALFNGIRYDGVLSVSDEYYHILIPNPRVPGEYNLEVWVWDADDDGWGPDSTAYHAEIIFKVIDDDLDPPTVSYSNDWKTFDNEDYLEIILDASDPSGIGEVYAIFNGIRYDYDPLASNPPYHILIPNPLNLGMYEIDIWVWDNDNDGWLGDASYYYEKRSFIVLDDDIIPPEFELIQDTMVWDGDNINLPFYIDAYDESGIDSIQIEIEGYSFIGPGWHYLILPSGIYNMSVSVTDGDNDRPGDSLTTTKKFEIILDLTPPETIILLDTYYLDEFDAYYITSNTIISLEANDDVSGVASTYYSVNGEPFKEYLSSFSITGENGIYTIAYYSIDNSGNVEETKYLNVSLTNLKVESYITQGFCKKIDDFDVIFRKARMNGITGYKLMATNPGQMFYHIIIENTWPIFIENLVINIGLPDDFTLKGRRPIHVFMNRWSINRWCSIEDNIVQISNIKPGKRIHIITHIEYRLKGTFFETVEDDWSIDYNFESTINADGILEGDYSTSYTITARKKCIGHYLRYGYFHFKFHSRCHHTKFKFCCGIYGTKSIKYFSIKLSYKLIY